MSDRKLKPLPPDPFRHQDSAIAQVGVQVASKTIATLLARNPASALTGAEAIYGTQSGRDVGILMSQISAYVGFQVNVFDYLTPAQQAGVSARNGSDVTEAIANAIAAIPSTGGMLIFPPGLYRTSVGFTLANPTLVMGFGSASNFDPTVGVTQIECTSATATLFTVTAKYAKFRDLAMLCTATATAGAAIFTNSSDAFQRVDYDSLVIANFYNGIHIGVGCQWVMTACQHVGFVNVGVLVENTVDNDAGDWTIQGGTFLVGDRSLPTSVGIKVLSSGGGRIINNKCQGGGNSPLLGNAVVLAASRPPTSGQLMIVGNDVENVGGSPILINPGWDYVIISDNFLKNAPSDQPAISLAHCRVVSITNNILVGGGGTGTAIVLTNCDRVTVGPQRVSGFGSGLPALSLSDCTDIHDCSNVPTTVENLPPASSLAPGSTAFVNDATATTFSAPVVGGGQNSVPIYSDGHSWKIG